MHSINPLFNFKSRSSSTLETIQNFSNSWISAETLPWTHAVSRYIYKKKKKKRRLSHDKEYSKQAKSLLVRLTNDSVKNTTEFVQLACLVNKRRKSLQRKLVELHLPVDWMWKKKKIAIIGVMGRCWKKKRERERNLESLQGSNFLSLPPLFILSLPNECFLTQSH